MKLTDVEGKVDVTEHPCFSDGAHGRVGRVHLPVAPRCNIQCNFCERNVCATQTMQHPGWTAKLLSATEAAELVSSVVRSKPAGHHFVVGVAGPGDPLANERTFEALGLIHKEHPSLLKCVSTNGLLLEDRLPEVISVGVKALTVTINASDVQVGMNVYSWVTYKGAIYCGEEAAGLLLKKQLDGAKMAAKAGLAVKVNTVLIPGVNDHDMARLALRVKEAGARLMNIMPLIPSGGMKNRRGPSCEELKKAKIECEQIMPQFLRCEHCRADVVYTPW